MKALAPQIPSWPTWHSAGISHPGPVHAHMQTFARTQRERAGENRARERERERERASESWWRCSPLEAACLFEPSSRTQQCSPKPAILRCPPSATDTAINACALVEAILVFHRLLHLAYAACKHTVGRAGDIGLGHCRMSFFQTAKVFHHLTVDKGQSWLAVGRQAVLLRASSTVLAEEHVLFELLVINCEVLHDDREHTQLARVLELCEVVDVAAPAQTGRSETAPTHI